MDLDEQLDRVDSKKTFLAFVAALRADWEASQAEEKIHPSSPYGPDARGWENPSLGMFLEAMQAWAEDMGERLPEAADWQTFAAMLLAGKHYE